MHSLAHTVVHVMRKVVTILVGSAMVLWKSEVATVPVNGMVLAMPCSVHSKMKHTCKATIFSVEGWNTGTASSQLQCTVAYDIAGKNITICVGVQKITTQESCTLHLHTEHPNA